MFAFCFQRDLLENPSDYPREQPGLVAVDVFAADYAPGFAASGLAVGEQGVVVATQDAEDLVAYLLALDRTMPPPEDSVRDYGYESREPRE